MRKLLALVAIVLLAFSVSAANAGSCGQIVNLEVVYQTVDNMGIAPRPAPGSENQFNCIANHDPNFTAARFPSSWQAANYWFVLLGQELGAPLQPLPAPTN